MFYSLARRDVVRRARRTISVLSILVNRDHARSSILSIPLMDRAPGQTYSFVFSIFSARGRKIP
jgi:hypothetical protein